MTYLDRSFTERLAEYAAIQNDERLGRYVGFTPEERPLPERCQECGSHSFTEHLHISRQFTMFDEERREECWRTCDTCGAVLEAGTPRKPAVSVDSLEDELEERRRIA